MPFRNLPPGIYSGTITQAAPEKSDDGSVVVDKWGRQRIIIKVALFDDNGDGNTVEVRRYFAISYGQSKDSGRWSALAEFLEAVTGTKCGDKAQQNIKGKDILGKPLRVKTANVEKDGKTYTNMVEFFPANASDTRPPAAAEIEDEIPF